MAVQPLPAVEWSGDSGGCLRMVDQTRLPAELHIMEIVAAAAIREAIVHLRVRGAPAIGAAAGFGLHLGVRNAEDEDEEEFLNRVDRVAADLDSARPTAVNLSYALRRVRTAAASARGLGVAAIKERIFREALAIDRENTETCRAMGKVGAEVIGPREGVLTHCNTGGLAAAWFGTALGVIIEAHLQGKEVAVFVDETRPLLQGARLTTWELMRAGVPNTLICDNAAAKVMAEGRVQRVLVGADRIAANGDAANKIGTYAVAVLAERHSIPFHVVAPTSTFDLGTSEGRDIPIEERAPEEVTEGFGKRVAPEGVRVYSPAFDVTPARLITSIITEKGVIAPVTAENVRAVVAPS